MPTTKKLHVLHVTPYFDQAWAYGGIPRVAATQVRELRDRGLRISVATTDAGSAIERTTQTDVDGIDLHIFPNASNRMAHRQQLFLPRGLRSFLSANAYRFDVAHLHACHNLLTTTAAAAMRRADIPYVVQPNGTARRIERRRALKWVFDRLFGRRVLPGAARVIAVSTPEQGHLEGLGIPLSQQALLPNPIDLKELEAPRDPGFLRRKYSLGEAPLILYLGQISPRKRVDLCVETLARLEDPRSHLVIAGADMGHGDAVRRRISDLNLGHRVFFAGVLTGGDRLAALSEADLVLYPTEDEIFGLVPLEALLCGTPVVVSDDCGCGEIIQTIGGGLVTPVGDADALTAAAQSMLSRPDRWKQPVTAAAETIRSRFGAATVCAGLEQLYLEVIQ